MLESFAFYISTLRKQFNKYCSERLEEMGISYGQLYVIIFVGKKEACSPSDVSNGLRLDAGHLNRTINKLIDNGFISQTKNEKDRRANVLTLTQKGEEVFQASKELFVEWDKKVLSSLNEEEKEQLMSLLKKVR
ncbi:MAG: MarR family transcriptional regulator [Erysipelotrichaceae bacterium]|nr:MarR family transcriptional regulator [Erysipelotrichaceae bacterium]MDY5251681.1 MarR family transcriptional regulator [Erysipelotrichaceae bacterium]